MAICLVALSNQFHLHQVQLTLEFTSYIIKLINLVGTYTLEVYSSIDHSVSVTSDEPIVVG